MSWFCSVYEKSFSTKDSMQRHMMFKHRNAGLTPFQTVPMFSQKCQRFRFEHPFTSMVCRNDRLVLFTMAARVYTNVSRHATH